MPNTWKPLKPGPFKRRASTPGADPMWVWADATGYRDVGRLGPDKAVWVMTSEGGRTRSRQVTPSQWMSLPDDAELAMPVVPERMPPSPTTAAVKPLTRLAGSTLGRVLVGIIDSGCPFAARMIRDASGTGTRVLALWNQDGIADFGQRGWSHPELVPYGRAVSRQDLNALMSHALRPGGGMDEAACYEAAGLKGLRQRTSHGAAVMSQLFASPLYGGALQPSPGRGPSWDVAAKGPLPIDTADLVFVDIPRAGLQDSTSAALARYILDGIHFIMAHAVKGQKVVINISTGTSRTTHDGGSLIEKGLEAAVQDAEARGVELHLVLPVGNGNMEQRHAVIGATGDRLTLFVPPGCETPQYVTVRWPARSAGLRLVVTPPAGPSVSVRQGEAQGLTDVSGAVRCGVVWARAVDGRPSCALLAFGPTASFDPATPQAPAGRWTIAVQGQRIRILAEPVRFWVSRNQRNPGALPRGRQADFVDVGRLHHPRAWLRYTEDDPAAYTAPSGIRRAGALTGLATAAMGAWKKHIHAVGAFSGRSDGLPVGAVSGRSDGLSASPYSAAGEPGQALPTISALGDSSRALPGLSVRGNHGGEVARMVGTSFAAPLVARSLVNGVEPHRQKKGPAASRLGAALLEP